MATEFEIGKMMARSRLALHHSSDLKPLWLNREEALALLELTIASTAAPGPAEEPALHKLGDLCRAFLREDAGPRPVPDAAGNRHLLAA